MDHSSYSNANAHPFSDHPLFDDSVVLAHAACMILAFVVCYPIAITLAAKRQSRPHVIVSCIGTAFVVLGWGISWYIDRDISASSPSDEMAMQHHDSHSQPRDDVSLSTTPETYGIKLDRSAHSGFSRIMLLLLIVQVACGLYSYITTSSTASSSPSPSSSPSFYSNRFPNSGHSKFWQTWVPRALPVIHSILGKAFLLLAYVQIVLGLILVSESCGSEYFAQCMAHIIMGSTFLWYGTLSLLYLFAVFSMPRGSVPEFYESILITVWGVINSFALHRWGTPWSHQDLQHTSLGVLWWAGGVLGLVLNFQKWFPVLRDRNPMPAVIVALTGLAMGSHSQHHGFAISVHQFFGMSLIGGAAARLAQVATRPVSTRAGYNHSEHPFGTFDDDEEEGSLAGDRFRRGARPNALGSVSSADALTSFSVLAGFFASLGIMTAGVTFMAANENWLNIVTYYIDDPSTYINLIVTLVLVWFTYIVILTSLTKYSFGPSSMKGYNMMALSDEHELSQANGLKYGSRHVRTSSSSSSSTTSMRPSEYLAKRKSTLAESPTGDTSAAAGHRKSWSLGGVADKRSSWLGGKSANIPVEVLEEVKENTRLSGARGSVRGGVREQLFAADIEMDGLIADGNKM